LARKLKEFPGGPTRGRYPWDQWLDGSVWLLRKGEDYEIEGDDHASEITVPHQKRASEFRQGLLARPAAPGSDHGRADEHRARIVDARDRLLDVLLRQVPRLE
jgi:hypothetical protein